MPVKIDVEVVNGTEKGLRKVEESIRRSGITMQQAMKILDQQAQSTGRKNFLDGISESADVAAKKTFTLVDGIKTLNQLNITPRGYEMFAFRMTTVLSKMPALIPAIVGVAGALGTAKVAAEVFSNAMEQGVKNDVTQWKDLSNAVADFSRIYERAGITWANSPFIQNAANHATNIVDAGTNIFGDLLQGGHGIRADIGMAAGLGRGKKTWSQSFWNGATFGLFDPDSNLQAEGENNKLISDAELGQLRKGRAESQESLRHRAELARGLGGDKSLSQMQALLASKTAEHDKTAGLNDAEGIKERARLFNEIQAINARIEQHQEQQLKIQEMRNKLIADEKFSREVIDKLTLDGAKKLEDSETKIAEEMFRQSRSLKDQEQQQEKLVRISRQRQKLQADADREAERQHDLMVDAEVQHHRDLLRQIEQQAQARERLADRISATQRKLDAGAAQQFRQGQSEFLQTGEDASIGGLFGQLSGNNSNKELLRQQAREFIKRGGTPEQLRKQRAAARRAEMGKGDVFDESMLEKNLGEMQDANRQLNQRQIEAMGFNGKTTQKLANIVDAQANQFQEMSNRFQGLESFVDMIAQKINLQNQQQQRGTAKKRWQQF